MLGIIDRYIIRKFISTFFFVSLILLLVCIAVDVTEKLHKFVENNAPLDAIVFDYYVAFIPYISALLGPFFVFIAVIFFTSKLTYNSEIIAVLATGGSFGRLLRPFMVSALLLSAGLYVTNHYIVPAANKKRLDFEFTYVHNLRSTLSNIEFACDKTDTSESIVSINRYNKDENDGFQMVKSIIHQGEVVRILKAPKIEWKDSAWVIPILENWDLKNSKMVQLKKLDTILGFTPQDFKIKQEFKMSMTKPEIEEYIERELAKGNGEVNFYIIENYARTASALSIIILSVLGMGISSRKVRGGTGVQLVVGLILTFAYLLLQRFFNTFATNSDWDPMFAVYLPNLLYIGLAVYFVLKARK